MHCRPMILALAIVQGVLWASFSPESRAEEQTRRIPLIYGTDLVPPHDDPDDHLDLATVCAMRAATP